jgi:hypothetical protein
MFITDEKKSFLRDLFKGPGNLYWDLGRIAVGVGLFQSFSATAWNIYLGQPIDLGPAGLLGGMGAFFTGCAALIYAKDKSVTGK